MSELLSPADLAPFAEIDPDKAQAMIDDVLALAGLAAPCLDDENLDESKAKAARAILRGAVLRWNEAGQGGRTQVTETTGPFQYSETFDNSRPRRSLLWPSEITQLQAICSGDRRDRKPWSYDTAGGGGLQHGDTCAVNLGATFCDCGAIYTGGGPLWGSSE
ncbi:head-to-tail adaptor [Mycobacterium phage IdentityCrisis]|uniref:Head-to-tail adaptor n=1 Tax=Mycobacterium phage IdentityCrisis TaxID=2599866 RepID=A0A5J6THZ4_9CAUD|nr:head-to-tail adaptor [Mycobacterium phage IdentityCrisis]QFG10028.1 head-to-tail adaptor [Mycobacterium phage IdentityCrisis]